MIRKVINKYKYWDTIITTRRLTSAFSKDHQVKLYNWSRPFPQDSWLIHFIENRGLLKGKPNARIALYSIFGPIWLTRFDRADARIFVERENLHKPTMQSWLHRFLDDNRIDLSLGFDDLNHSQYLRFPFWAMWDIFSPTADFNEIKSEINRMNSPENSGYDNRKYCAYVCSHDDKGRKRIYEEFNSIDRIDCDGKLFHNNDDLKLKYNDNKLDYLKNYRFNLTPENTNFDKYVTEKLFEAISSGCIPIYHGSNNNPEPEILNHDAIIFVEIGKENLDAVNFVRNLNNNRNLYIEFARQPRFKPNAEEIIWSYYEELESKIKNIIANI